MCSSEISNLDFNFLAEFADRSIAHWFDFFNWIIPDNLIFPSHERFAELIGLKMEISPSEFYVFNNQSHNAMHRHFVYQPNFDRFIYWHYFHRYFDKGEDLLPNNNTGYIDGNYYRIDRPVLDPKGQLLGDIEAHLVTKTGNALYITGTWKHGPTVDIPKMMFKQLCKWGFKIPLEEYPNPA